MKKYTYIVPLLLLGIFASSAATYAMQFGANDNGTTSFTPGHMFHGEMHTPRMNEQRSAIHTAFENNDYSSFVEIMQSRPNAPPVTQEQFNTLREAHILRMNGKFQKAQDLLDAAGIERPQRMGRR